MTTMADSLVNSAMRPLRLRRRPDLESRRHRYDGRAYWVVKEPVGLNYFRFHEEEFAILNMLNGQTSLQQIRESFQAEFAPQRISLQDLQQFVGMLHRSGLVISHAGGQGRQLRRRGDQKRKKELLGKFVNVFAIRFRGIDPERILNRLLPWFGWLFTTWCIMLVAVIGLMAITLVLVNYQEFKGKLPTFQQFFAANNWIWLGGTMAAVKILHEFGHGLSCKKFGGECHEMGFMMLVFTPCLYCNVSDSWMLPNKWQRVFIGAAGMYVELILASIATFLWWFSEDGMFRFLCLSVMFICSVSTVVFNGNPLLRFDGYYITMDTLEIPNLRQKSSEILKRWFQKTCLGLELQDNPFLPTRNSAMFGIYTIASFIYRWVVAFGIIMFLNQVLKPYGLQSLGRAFAVAGVAGMVVPAFSAVYKFLKTPGRAAKIKQGNVLTSLGIASAVLAFLCFFPLPYHVYCPSEAQPREALEVHTLVAGKLVGWQTKPGQPIAKNAPICKLENLDLTIKIQESQSEIRFTESQIEQATYLSNTDRRMIRELDALRSDLKKKQDVLTTLKEKEDNLIIRSPIDGFVVQSADKEESKAAKAQGQLPGWFGNPFADCNSEAVFSEGELVCLVAPTREMEAVIVVDQHDREELDEGNEVEFMFDAAALVSVKGKIIRFSESELKEVSPSLSITSGGTLDTKTDEMGKTRPISTSYPATVELIGTDAPLRAGYRGNAKVHLAWKSLGSRFYRYVLKTFNFEF
ncbi:MAG: hemolysin D [Planctomycetota bacterium]|nr:hemolysin D [Planctomycetota bacterium]